MFRSQGSIRKALLAGLVSAFVTSAVMAQTAVPATGLGQAWPNAADVSASPNWHVYVFWLNGVKYIQINDLNGTVHAAVGTANGTAIVLPVGVDSQNVNTAASSAVSTAKTIYSDASTKITATPKSNGTTQFNVIANSTSCPDIVDCSAVAPAVN
jgi:hypothetical protein